MSDHLIAEANRHAMALPSTHPTHTEIAWYVRKVVELRADNERLGEERDEALSDLAAAQGEVERLKSNTGCARNQRSTQFCADLEKMMAESHEQARLLGMSAERECALRGKVDRLERELDALREDKVLLDWLDGQEREGEMRSMTETWHLSKVTGGMGKSIFAPHIRAAIDAARKEAK